ncbi:MAG: nuclear transport factor 2 family protein [Pseudomonadota bacterium]
MTAAVNALKIAENYITLWNERNDARRRDLLASHWTGDARYIDPMAAGEGPAAIDTMIAGVQQRFPDFEFALIGQPDSHGPYVRFQWGLGPRGGDNPIKGTDFVVTEGGRIRSVTGFLDQVPG